MTPRLSGARVGKGHREESAMAKEGGRRKEALAGGHVEESAILVALGPRLEAMELRLAAVCESLDVRVAEGVERGLQEGIAAEWRQCRERLDALAAELRDAEAARQKQGAGDFAEILRELRAIAAEKARAEPAKVACEPVRPRPVPFGSGAQAPPDGDVWLVDRVGTDITDDAEDSVASSPKQASSPGRSSAKAPATRHSRSIERSLHETFGTPTPHSKCARLHNSPGYLLFGVAVTLGYCLMLAFNIEAATGAAFEALVVVPGAGGIRDTTALRPLEVGFLVWFVLEFLIGIFAKRGTFCTEPGRFWNLLDAFVMCTVLFDLAGFSVGLSFARAVRICRLAKFLFLFPGMRRIATLHRLLSAGAAVTASLVWTGGLLLLVIFIAAMAIQEALNVYLSGADIGRTPDAVASLDRLRQLYGGLGRTMVTLFRGISGSDWSLLAEPLLPIGWGAGAMWFLYLVVVFGLLTTFTGAVVDVLRRPLPIDVEVAMAEEKECYERLLGLLRAELGELGMDDEGDPQVGKRTCCRLVETEAVAQLLRHRGVDFMVEDFFSIIDIEEIGSVPLTVLARRCIELSREPKAQDITRITTKLHGMRNDIRSSQRGDPFQAEASHTSWRPGSNDAAPMTVGMSEGEDLRTI